MLCVSEKMKEEIESVIDKMSTPNGLQELIESEDFQRLYQKMHTPWKRRAEKISRNDICPFCDSGKKFKKCECYEKYNNTPLYTINY